LQLTGVVHHTVVAGCQCVGDVWSTVRLQNATLGIQPPQLVTDLHHHLTVRQTLRNAADFANSLQRGINPLPVITLPTSYLTHDR